MATRLRPDPTFYPSPRLAMEAPDEQFAYVALLRPDNKKPDAIAVVDTKPGSKTYGKAVHKVELKVRGDELHHFNLDLLWAVLLIVVGAIAIGATLWG